MPVFKKLFFGTLACLFVLVPLTGHAAQPDWGKASTAKIVLFYPGVTSWDFLTSDDHRLGGREITQTRKDCRHCHLSKNGELDLKADEIASGAVRMKRSHNAFEPEPAAGKKGTMQATVAAAYDDEFLYLKFEWDSRGGGWLAKSDGVPDRVSVQFNKTEPSFRKYGCFITCHNDLNTMPKSPSKKEVAADPFYGSRDRDDVRLYAYYAKKSWSDRKNRQELDKRLKEGARIDLVSVEFIDGKSVLDEGWIFDDRVLEKSPGIGDSGSFTSGKYTAVLRKRLKSTDPYGVSIKPGEVVSIGVAIHDGGAAKRKHYVSFPMTVGLGTAADIRAEMVSK
ncbi:MAG: hypothetical protein HY889_08705 [Deltaproteobacteria bacterium]|nr:hypothetical protein [Deltaproteobacteria bacterium]